jgi:hypothetical protein
MTGGTIDKQYVDRTFVQDSHTVGRLVHLGEQKSISASLAAILEFLAIVFSGQGRRAIARTTVYDQCKWGFR